MHDEECLIFSHTTHNRLCHLRQFKEKTIRFHLCTKYLRFEGVFTKVETKIEIPDINLRIVWTGYVLHLYHYNAWLLIQRLILGKTICYTSSKNVKWA